MVKEVTYTRRFNAEFDELFFQKMQELKVYFKEKAMKKVMVKCVDFTWNVLVKKVEKTDYKAMIELMEEYKVTAQEAKKMLEG